jgi:hypothetical protein
MADVAGALGAAKAAFDLTKAFVDVRDATKVQAVRFELMGLLLQAQETEVSLIAEKRELEERVRDLEAWDGEKQRYELKDVGQGCIAYALKADAQGAEPPHSLCAGCYNQGRKSILVPFHISIGRGEALQCHTCGSEMVVRGIDGREGARIAYRAPSNKAGTWGNGRR